MSPPSDGASPMTFPISGHLSEEDIHELLGVMNGHDHASSVEHLATLDEHEASSPRHQEVISMPPQSNPGSFGHETTAANSDYASEGVDPDNGDSNGCLEEAVSERARAQARLQRKRSREKQRRSDVNKQFSDLTALLRRIEEEDLDAEHGMAGIPTGGPANRVDLIARTIAVLERMHDMSCKKRKEVVDLNKQLEEMKKMAEDTAARLKEATAYQQGPAKPVMMMVPMMVNPNMAAQQQPGATAAPSFAMASPFMQTPQQPAMFMPQITAPAGNTAAAMMAQVSTQVHPQQQQQPTMPAFPQAMFASTATPPPPAPAPQATLSPQQQGQKEPAAINGGSGNLAHCA